MILKIAGPLLKMRGARQLTKNLVKSEKAGLARMKAGLASMKAKSPLALPGSKVVPSAKGAVKSNNLGRLLLDRERHPRSF